MTGVLVPGTLGARPLNWGYAGYITEEGAIVSGGNLIIQNQKRPYTETDPIGIFEYTIGWIMSMHKIHFNKGYIPVPAKFLPVTI